MEKKKYYLTTAIAYASGIPHIGNVYEAILADAICRFKRLEGYDVFFQTGTDEHGQKIERKAKEKGMEPLAYVDGIVANFKKLWERLDITYDDFIRTSDERHKKVAQEIFLKIYQKGDIYKSKYQGWYCTPCETFWTERQLNDQSCPDCGRGVEMVEEESYFFRMSKYQDRLLEYIESNPQFIQPISRRNEMVSFIKGGLEDLCVSRTTFNWGIPVPIDEKHVIYVWFDALTNYISALGLDSQGYEKFWPCDVHLVGKDIMRFHTIIWPIILMAAEIPLPKKVFGHGWVLLAEGKMSKSKGNVVDPNLLIDKYGQDAIRYFLLRDIPFGQDGYYSEEALVKRINTDLANDFGNLLSRTTAMINKFADERIPVPGEITALEQEIVQLAGEIVEQVEQYMEKLEPNNALIAIWRLVNRCNKYIDEVAPWALAKEPTKADYLTTVLYTLAEAIRIVTVLTKPFMPQLAPKVWSQLGVADESIQTWESLKAWGGLTSGAKINRGEAIYPRIDLETLNTEEEQEKPQKEPVELAEDKSAEIGIEDFFKVELRVAEVVVCEKVPKADKLLKLQLKVGQEDRTVVSGIALHYTPEEMVGKKVVLVANLKPAKLRGIESQGMILAASDSTGKLEVITVDKDLPSGSIVK